MSSATVTTSTGSPTTPAAAQPSPSAGQAAAAPPRDLLTEAATAVALPFALARNLVPDSAVPVALGVGALAVAGVIEWPAAAAVALGYLALRGWRHSARRAA